MTEGLLNAPQTMPKAQRRPQVSLFAALLLMTIVGMAIVMANLWREIAPMRTELRALRTELGHLTIDDPTKIQAITVSSDDERTSRWRIYIPPGELISIHCNVGDVPQTGIPRPTDRAVPLDPVENLVTLKFFRDELDGKWKYRFGTSTATVRGMASDDKIWLVGDGFQPYGEGIGPAPLILPDFKSSYVLQRYRMSGRDDPYPKNTTEPLRGFIVWLDRN
jgi:hypothetical protein